MKKSLFVVSIALVAALSSSVAFASPLPPERISDWSNDSVNNAAWTAVASSPMTGKSLVVYYFEDDSGDASYFTQLLGPDGKAIGSPSLLSDSDVNIWQGPAVAWNPLSDGWLVCWSEVVSGGVDVYCRAVSAEGEVGPSYPSVISLGNQYVVNSVVWNPAREEFIVTAGAGGNAGSGASTPSGGAFVKASGELSDSLESEITPPGLDSCGAMNVAYSAASQVFGVAAYAITSGQARCAPWVWILDSSGNPLSEPVRIDPDGDIAYKQQSIAWSMPRDEFLVMSVRDENPSSGPTSRAFVVQRYKSSDGQPVGSLQEKVLPGTYLENRWRPNLIANPVSDQIRAFVTLRVDDDDDREALYSMPVAADGSLSDPELVVGGEESFYTGPRPWWTFNPYSCNYLGTFRGVESSSQLYTVRDTQPLPCKSELVVGKTGTGSGSVAGFATDSSALSMEPESVSEGTTELYRSTSVSLEATPAAGSTFSGWSGACSGTSTCVVTMSEAQSVTATFTADSPPPPSGEPKLKIKFQGPKKIRAGRPFRIRMTVSNKAQESAALSRSDEGSDPTTATNIKACVRLPRSVVLLENRSRARVEGRKVCWTKASLPAGSSVTHGLRAKTVRSASGAITFRGNASGSNAEGTTATATRTDRVKVVPAKKVRPEPPTG